MRQALYTATHGIHFGLASEAYTHFTSPIRRYPDLVVHRLIRKALKAARRQQTPPVKAARERMESELEEIAELSSYRERLADEAEREANRIKEVRLMAHRLGDEFDGRVSGVVESGLFVRLEDPFLEGFVAKETISDDFYEYDDDQLALRGQRKKRRFRLGDQVRIRAVKADLDLRKIDFALILPPC